MTRSVLPAILLLLLCGACGGPAAGGTGGVPAWPDSLPVAAAVAARPDYEPVRTIVHIHSVYSHDACDGEPQDGREQINPQCFARFRLALCAAHVGAVFLTEHDRWLVRADSLAEALLVRPGDARIEAGRRLVANRISCWGAGAAGDPALGREGPILFAGAENVLMPVGFDSLPRGSREERRAFYDADGAGAADAFRAYGAVVLLSHPEELTLERIAALAPDGLEIYNPHANFAPKHRESQGLSRLGAIFGLLPFYLRTSGAHPDLALLSLFTANRPAIRRWDALLARGPMVGFGASDAHENSLPWKLRDGDRGDSYFRMIPWVTNVLLIEPGLEGAERAAAIERALADGRLYTALEAWGTPAGFDFRLESPSGTVEMGETVPLAAGQRLVVDLPRVLDRAPSLPEPEVRARVFRIDPFGARFIVAEDSRRSIVLPVDRTGAYRVEIGIVPRHLGPYLGIDGTTADLREVVWIYSNAIRVVRP